LTVSSFAVNAFMHEKSPIAGGAVVGLVCGILAWVGAAVLLTMMCSDTYVHYLIQIPPGIPTGILCAGPAVLLLWVAGLIWGFVALGRIRRAEGALGGRAAAWTAIVLGVLPFVAAVLSPVVSTLYFSVVA
jgi:hypothetical protein